MVSENEGEIWLGVRDQRVWAYEIENVLVVHGRYVAEGEKGSELG
jgi:hypothetical protein